MVASTSQLEITWVWRFGTFAKQTNHCFQFQCSNHWNPNCVIFSRTTASLTNLAFPYPRTRTPCWLATTTTVFMRLMLVIPPIHSMKSITKNRQWVGQWYPANPLPSTKWTMPAKLWHQISIPLRISSQPHLSIVFWSTQCDHLFSLFYHIFIA